MRLLRIFSCVFLLSLAVGSSAAELRATTPQRADFDAQRLARLTAMLDEYVADGQIPGAAIRIIRDGRVVLEEAVGYQDLEAGVPLSTESIFRIASQTKAVVSVGIMMLQEEGRLLIGDPVGKYLPEWQETTVAVPDAEGGYAVVPVERPITIRDLLTHTAGIGYGWGPAADLWEEAGIVGWYFAHRREPVRETVRRMAALPMDAQPGSAFVYGYNTDILGALIEVISGRTLADFLREKIFEPLDMKDTHFYLPAEKRSRLAVVYSINEEGGDEEGSLVRAPDGSVMVSQGEYADGPRMSYSGGAGLLSTVRDYSRFLQMLAAGGSLDGERLLSPNTVQLMTLDHLNGIPFRAGEGFGLGFAVSLDAGARGVPGNTGEYGWGGAYHTVYFVDPGADLVVVYMTQILPATGLDDARKVRAIIYSALNDHH